MKVYHIDRNKTLFKGQTISLTPTKQFSDTYQQEYIRDLFGEDGVSNLGDIYTRSDIYVESNPILPLKETVFEYVRRIYFPLMPSRFQSFFSLKSLDDVEKWLSWFSISKRECYIWEIEVDHAVELDAAWRDSDHTYVATSPNGGVSKYILYDAASIHYFAKNYWEGEHHKDPKLSRLEYLSPLPVRVLKKLVL